jgi:hypothetical protein
MRTKQITLYQFDELEERAKERARDWYRQGGFDYEWWDCTFDDVKECLGKIGFSVNKIYFSGFSSQGDGACFEGDWSARSVDSTALKEHAPADTTLHALADEAARIAAQYPQASASMAHRGRYYHSHSVDVDVDLSEDDSELELTPQQWKERDEAREPDVDAIKELCRDAMDWIYRQLEKEYEYLTSDESVDETIRINEYEFDEDGNRA